MLQWLRRFRRGPSRPFPIWEGIFPDLRNVPSGAEAIESPSYVADVFRETERIRSSFRKGERGFLSDPNYGELRELVEHDQGISMILDFGGGMGIGYYHARAIRPNVAYHVVETQPMCEGGQRLREPGDGIHFHLEIPAIRPQLVYINSVLQYVDDYGGVLRTLCRAGAENFLMERLSAGDVPTYATAQVNVPGLRIPYRFFNFDEVASIMNESGYRCEWVHRCDDFHDQKNFPASHRLEFMSNVLFRRKGSL